MKGKWTKKIFGLFLAGTLLLQPVGVLAENQQDNTESTVLYQEDFEDGSVEGWDTDLTVEEEADGNHVWKIGGDWPSATLYNGKSDWTDYSVEADFRVDSWNEPTDSIMAPYQGFGISARVSGSGKWSALYRESTHQMELFKTPGGKQDNKEFQVETGVWYTMKMELSGKQVTVYFYPKGEEAGEPLFQFIDEANSFTFGGIAPELVYVNLSIDNIKVTEIIRAVPVESVSLNYTEYSVKKGDTFQLEGTVLPEKGTNKNLVWSSSDDEIATVDQNGKVTGVGNGTAVITAASEENPEIKAECRVEVFETVTERQEFYVAPDGSDDNMGTIEEPFATVQKARNEVRKQLSQGQKQDITVYIRGGTYYLEDSIVLNQQDSGNNGHTVTYRNYGEEEVRIVGGTPVTGWSDEDGDGIYEADVSDRGDFYALFENGERLTAAKEENWRGITVKDPSHMQAVYGGPTNWFGEVLKVKSFDGQTVTTNFAPGNMSGGLWYLQGAREYINEPGEWAIENGTVYYKPLDGTSPEGKEMIAPQAERIFYLKGTQEDPVENIIIEGLSLEMNAFGEDLRAHANGDRTAELQSNLKGIVDLDNAVNVQVRNCSLTGGGYMAVVLNHYCQNNTVYGNYMEDTGYAGIFLIGENPGSLNYINKKNVISNNMIKNVGKFVGHGSGIYLMNSGENTITHNNISGMNRYGISMKGIRYGVFGANGITGVDFDDQWQYNQTTKNYIGYNVIYNTGMYSADGGGVEGWGIGRDNWIDHNIIYNAYRGVATTGWRGHSVFTDDATHHTMVTNNIIYDENAVTVNAGTMMKSIDNYVSNNVFDVGYAYNGAVNVGPYIEPCGNMTFQKNIVYSQAEGTLNADGTWTESGNGDRVMLKMDNDYSTGTPTMESMVSMDHNLYYNAKGNAIFEILGNKLSLTQWQDFSGNIRNYDANSILADPNFKDASNRDYRLEADSPAYELGITSIDSSQIGLLPDFQYADTEESPKILYLQAANGALTANVLQSGETLQLTGITRTETGYASDDLSGIVYESSNPAVASVDENGLITAGEAGTAVITASVNGLSDTYTVYVGDTIEELIADDISLTSKKNEASYVNPLLKTAQGRYITPTELSYSVVSGDSVTVDEKGRVQAQQSGSSVIEIKAVVNGKTVTTQVTAVVDEEAVELRDPYQQNQALDADTLGGGANRQSSCVGMDSDGSYVVFENFDFGDGAKRFTANYATGNVDRLGKIELRLDSLTGPVIGTVDCNLTAAWGVYDRSWIEVDPEVVNGVHDLYVIANPGALNLSDIQFSQKGAGEEVTGISASGPEYLSAPQTGELTYQYQAFSLDDLGYESELKDVVWSLDGTYQGISIDPETGVLTVGIPGEKKTSIQITAQSKQDSSLRATVEALVYDGTIVELTGQQADEKNSTGIDGPGVAFQGAGSWIKFKDFDFHNGIEEYEFKYSYPNNDNNALNFFIDSNEGEAFYSHTFPGTGAWANYVEHSQTVDQSTPTGVHDLVISQNDWLNFHWIRFYMPNDRSVPETYTATIEGGTGSGDYESGDVVSITAQEPEGQRFVRWVSEDVELENADSKSTSFVMPAKKVTVTAEFEKIPAEKPVLEKDLPASVKGKEGESLKLEVSAVSPDGGTLTYQWYFNGKAIEGANGSSYEIGQAEKTDAGEYQVEITNTLKNGEQATITSSVCTVLVEETSEGGGSSSEGGSSSSEGGSSSTEGDSSTSEGDGSSNEGDNSSTEGGSSTSEGGSSSNESEIPATGQNTMVLFVAVVLLITAGMGVLLVLRRKEA